MGQLEIKAMAEEAFEQLGGGEIAYVRPVMSEEVESLFPGAPSLQPGLRLWALLNADGTPIVLTDSRAAAVANAHEHDLETVSVH
ncbi:MAG TPA: DUF1150 domain-containing protein [Afifellaceae bacterium]|nr:DUF1150 domain-containing protein [Afifellaceae bacterium]